MRGRGGGALEEVARGADVGGVLDEDEPLVERVVVVGGGLLQHLEHVRPRDLGIAAAARAHAARAEVVRRDALLPGQRTVAHLGELDHRGAVLAEIAAGPLVEALQRGHLSHRERRGRVRVRG